MKIIHSLSFWLISLFFTLVLPLQAQKYSNEFLSIGVGAGAQGMGNVHVATVSDVTSAYWNPAGLIDIDESLGLQLGVMHAEWFAGVGNYDFLGATIPSSNGKSRIGLSLIRFGIDDIPNTLSLFEADGTVNYDNVVPFSAADHAFIGTYSRNLSTSKGNLSIGANAKVVRRIIGTFADSWGFGLDFGLKYSISYWQFGLMARDITSTNNAWRVNYTASEKEILLSTGNELPKLKSNETTLPSFLIGMAGLWQLGDFSFQPQINFLLTTDGRRNTAVSGNVLSLDPRMGLEIAYKSGVFLRAGVDQFQQVADIQGNSEWIARPAIGVGLKIMKFDIDYAFSDLGDTRNTYSNIISFKLNLNKSKRGN